MNLVAGHFGVVTMCFTTTFIVPIYAVFDSMCESITLVYKLLIFTLMSYKHRHVMDRRNFMTVSAKILVKRVILLKFEVTLNYVWEFEICYNRPVIRQSFIAGCRPINKVPQLPVQTFKRLSHRPTVVVIVLTEPSVVLNFLIIPLA